VDWRAGRRTIEHNPAEHARVEEERPRIAEDEVALAEAERRRQGDHDSR
jgi:hypothetical protein